MGHPLALVGLSDGGAHVGTVCDASCATFALTHWADIDLRDRGTVVGQRADLNVIDPEKLALHRPRMAADLPAGGRRLVQHATGYRATTVAGEVIVESDRMTDARPGRLVRMG